MSGSPSEVVALGLGTAGTRIVSALKKERTFVNRFAFVSCDAADLELAGDGDKVLIDGPVMQKLTPPMVRGLALAYREQIETMVKGAKVVFIVAGLGRATGSGLAPVVAQAAREAGATPVSIAVMPFDFEEKLKFHAGLALKQLRKLSTGVVVVDNDALFTSASESTLKEIYELANAEAVKALGSLLSDGSGDSIPVGANSMLGTISQEGYTFLNCASSGSIDKVEEALARAIIGIGKKAQMKEASHAVVVLTGDSMLSAGDTALAVKRLGSMLGNPGTDVEYAVSYRGGAQLQVSVLASGFKATKYDDYDPLTKIFGTTNVIDDTMEYSQLPGLDELPSCG